MIVPRVPLLSTRLERECPPFQLASREEVAQSSIETSLPNRSERSDESRNPRSEIYGAISAGALPFLQRQFSLARYPITPPSSISPTINPTPLPRLRTSALYFDVSDASAGPGTSLTDDWDDVFRQGGRTAADRSKEAGERTRALCDEDAASRFVHEGVVV